MCRPRSIAGFRARPEIIGDEATVRDRLAELAQAGVDEYVGAVFDSSAEGRDRTRALLREVRSEG